MPVRYIGFFILLFLAPLATVAQQTAQPTPRADCSPDLSEPTAGETALAGRNYQTALTFYQNAIKAAPNSEEARLGAVEAMIGLNNTSGALDEAKGMSAKNPGSALSVVAMADTLYRLAHFSEAIALLSKELPNHLCESRLHARYARIARDNALYETAWKQYEIAHRLRPNDEIIRRQWIDTLPRKRRLEELGKYLEAPHSLSASEAVNYVAEEDHLKAHHEDECRVTSKAESTTVPFKPIFHERTSDLRAYGLDVAFNGKRRRMQIDSGASGIILSPDAAKGLNLTREFVTRTGGLGDKGDVDSFFTHVEHIAIGDVELSNCMVEVLGKSEMDGDGLIGTDVFDRWLVTLNYPETKLTLEPLPPRPGPAVASASDSMTQATVEADEFVPRDRYIAPQMADWLKIVRIGHTILLPARIGKGTEQHYLIADTGAFSSLLSKTAAEQAGRIEPSDVRIVGISGYVQKTYLSEDLPLSFGHFLLPPGQYIAIDLSNISNGNGTEISGLIGLRTLLHLTIAIDYRDNLLKMSYDPKHDHSPIQ